MDRNNGNASSPWSLRQVGIYQQADPQSKKSVWILLQPSKHIYDRLQEILRNKAAEKDNSNQSPMILHILFLSSTVMNWRDFIESLRSEIMALVSRASRSDVL